MLILFTAQERLHSLVYMPVYAAAMVH